MSSLSLGVSGIFLGLAARFSRYGEKFAARSRLAF
jgi:hypothetical protein